MVCRWSAYCFHTVERQFVWSPRPPFSAPLRVSTFGLMSSKGMYATPGCRLRIPRLAALKRSARIAATQSIASVASVVLTPQPRSPHGDCFVDGAELELNVTR